MIKAILFDMDGVLIEAKDWHYEALNRALRNFGLEISRHDHLTTYDGLPTKKKLEMLSVEMGLPRRLHTFLNELKQKYTLEIVSTLCRPTFAHEYALARLKSENYKIAVCSNSVRTSVDTMLSLAGIDSYMDLTLSNEDVKNSKPDPEIYVTAMKKFGLDAHECLVLEDNENGIKAAYASGAHVLEIGTTEDTNYDNIAEAINLAEQRSGLSDGV